MSRCFVALRPPPDVVDVIGDLSADEIEGLRWTRREELHVTLRFFPEVDAAALVEAVGAVRHEAVDVVAGPAIEAMFGHVVALPVRGADDLAGAVTSATVHLLDVDRPFHGHLTVGRFRKGRRPAFTARPCEVAWRATSFAVVESRPTDGRHVHTTLAEVPLADVG